MVIWSGFGFVVAIVVFACSLLMEWITERATGNEEFYQQSPWALPLALLTGGVISSLIAIAFVPAHERNRHTLFFIPMLWWGPLLAVIAAAILIYRLITADVAAIPDGPVV